MNYFEAINKHAYLYLDSINEPEENTLLFELAIGEVSTETQSINVGNSVISGVREVLVDDKPTYSIYFDFYIAYTIIDESFALPPRGNEKYNGHLYRIYEHSDYLDYLKKSTYALQQYEDEIKHYEFVCQNHVINVVTILEPEIRTLKST